MTSFLAVYYPAMDVLREPRDFHDLAAAYLAGAPPPMASGHVEMFFDPQAHTSRGVPFEDVVTGYHRAAVEAAELGIDADLIMCFLRDHSAESAAENPRGVGAVPRTGSSGSASTPTNGATRPRSSPPSSPRPAGSATG